MIPTADRRPSADQLILVQETASLPVDLPSFISSSCPLAITHSYQHTPMQAPNALKQRYKGHFDDDGSSLAQVSLFSPETLVDAAIRSPFASFGKRVRGETVPFYDDDTPSGKKRSSPLSSPRTALSAWCLYLGFLFVLISAVFRIHYALPSPVYEDLHVTSGKPRFSEENVRQVIRKMTEDIGYRVVGTEQELDTKKYLISKLKGLKDAAELETLKGSTELPNFDMWVQVGDGSHRFDFMSKGKVESDSGTLLWRCSRPCP